MWNAKSNEKKARIEIFNYNNKEDFSTFQEATEDCPDLLECFNGDEDVNISSKKWLKTFNNILQKSFKKVRINKTRNDSEIDKLLEQREEMKLKLSKEENNENLRVCLELEDTINDLDNKIGDICADKNKKIAEDYLKHASDGIEGFSEPSTWKMKKLLAPKNDFDPPSAKLDTNGNLVSDLKSLEKLYLDTYLNRLKPNEMDGELKNLERLKEFLFQLRYDLAKETKSPDWTLEDIEEALKTFKNNKARDALGHTYELFKFGGRDLKLSILKLFNLIKSQQKYPEILEKSNISSFYKKSGSKNDLDNERGVFNVIKLRSILDKLIYIDKYHMIDESMSCSNIGGRKNRNIRDHLFVINGILNDAKKNKQSDIDIQIYDVKKCFDKLWYEETANDLFDAGVNDDKFVTIANSNQNCQVSIKTSWGTETERKTLNNIEMQGTVITSIKCSAQIDTLGKECLATGDGLFKYKGCLSVPRFALVDDVLTVSECGVDSIKLNAIVNSKMATKKLELGYKKCFQIHVGNKTQKVCPTLSVHNQDMKTSSSETYLGDILSSDCKVDLNIQARYQKGVGKVNTIFSLLQEISFGQHFYEMAMMFRSSMMINSILCSSEVLYGVQTKHTKLLEKCDKLFFTKLFCVPNSCTYESFFLETNAISIRFILIGRRLMYYWCLLNKSDDELAKKVLEVQKQHRCKDDWINEIEENLQFCQIDLNEEAIKKMKKSAFQKLVNQKMKMKADEFLSSLRDQHSKTENLLSYSFQEYLKCEDLDVKQKQLLFKLRSRSVHTKANYKNKYKFDLSCSLCKDKETEETDSHLLVCPAILPLLKHPECLKDVKHSDIFGELPRQIKVTKVYQEIFKIMRILKEN